MSLGIFMNFNKVKSYLEAITSNKAKHLDLLRKSLKTSETLVLNKTKNKVFKSKNESFNLLFSDKKSYKIYSQ